MGLWWAHFSDHHPNAMDWSPRQILFGWNRANSTAEVLRTGKNRSCDPLPKLGSIPTHAPTHQCVNPGMPACPVRPVTIRGFWRRHCIATALGEQFMLWFLQEQRCGTGSTEPSRAEPSRTSVRPSVHPSVATEVGVAAAHASESAVQVRHRCKAAPATTVVSAPHGSAARTSSSRRASRGWRSGRGSGACCMRPAVSERVPTLVLEPQGADPKGVTHRDTIDVVYAAVVGPADRPGRSSPAARRL
jgi:hypothetical protein